MAGIESSERMGMLMLVAGELDRTIHHCVKSPCMCVLYMCLHVHI